MTPTKERTILIVGGGFAGVETAKKIAAKRLPNTRIILISNKHHFEYYPALYRVVTGKSPLEVCIPLTDIFRDRRVEVVVDDVLSVDPVEKKVVGKSGSSYHYEYLVLALGSETVYFNIPGLAENSFGFKSINEALVLKEHLHALFDKHARLSAQELAANFQIAVVGGGASGVELSAELLSYVQDLARRHEIGAEKVRVTLIEAAPRLVPLLPEKMSEQIKKQLELLGVTVMLNEAVTAENKTALLMKDLPTGHADGAMPTKTVIWTSGVKPNHLYATIPGIQMEKNGRVAVTETLEAKGLTNIFIVGDAANTQYSGMAQTALYDGGYIAQTIANTLLGKKVSAYTPKKVAYCIPVGRGWAIFKMGSIEFSGLIAYFIREFIDLSFFMSVLPLGTALDAWRGGTQICESCPTCLEAIDHSVKK